MKKQDLKQLPLSQAAFPVSLIPNKIRIPKPSRESLQAYPIFRYIAMIENGTCGDFCPYGKEGDCL